MYLGLFSSNFVVIGTLFVNFFCPVHFCLTSKLHDFNIFLLHLTEYWSPIVEL